MVKFTIPIKMNASPNTKLVMTGAALLVVIVGCSVAVTRAYTTDIIPGQNVSPDSSAKIVQDIREKMNDTKVVNVPIQAYIIPSVDAHQSEYVLSSENRIKYVSGFTGSSATVVITEGAAALWTDSRYHIQAEKQLDNETWTLMRSGLPDVPTIEMWFIRTLPPNSRIGIDPFLIKASEFHELNEKLQVGGHKLVSIQQNLVDLIWKNRPEPKLKELEIIEPRYSGKKASDKLKAVRLAIEELQAESHIVTGLDDIAWLLNLRGSDIEMTPVFYAYVIITQKELHLYLLDEQRHTDKIYNHFFTEGLNIKVQKYSETLNGIIGVIQSTTGKVLLSGVSEAIRAVVPFERSIESESPILKMKIIKNEIEAEGMREAHKRDGAAVIKYLYWLENEIDDRPITELKGAEQLNLYRRSLLAEETPYRGQSFATISAVGANAAIVHYAATPETDTQITRNELYLIDSGAHYIDGTTDITRTVHFGTPTDQEIDAFTRVLKGFISVATAVFPPGAPFSFFDAMARRALWDVGLEYDHATGHGVGCYLNVHEIPPLITSENSWPGMLKNMFTTNEPGYYKRDAFGIRIEDILQVVDAPNSSHYFNGVGAYKFEDITMVPIQTKLINIDLLSNDEIKWLNEYHKRVRENVTPLLGNNSSVVDWLWKQTEPIAKKSDCNNHPPTETTAPSVAA